MRVITTTAPRPEAIEAFRGLNWSQCSRLLSRAFTRRGYSVAVQAAGSGADLVLRRPGQHLLVRCRQWNVWEVGARPVVELATAVSKERADGGIVVTCGSYSRQAEEAAYSGNISLVDGDSLMAMVGDISAN
jgi:restriction system protein